MAKYWFRKRRGLKSKDMGIGFIPTSLAGVFSYIVLFALIAYAGFYFNLLKATVWQGFGFLVAVIVLLIVFSLLAKRKTSPDQV